MNPTLDEVRKIAQTGLYKRIPVCRELYADRYTPVEVMRTLRKASRHCYLLESASQTEVWGRYSFLGYEPEMEITCTDGLMKIRHTGGTNEEIIKKKTSRRYIKRDHPGIQKPCNGRYASFYRRTCGIFFLRLYQIQ